jgi:hypothetical protein
MSDSDINARIAELRKTIPILHWGRLRFIGSLRTLSVSYIVGAAVALPRLAGTDDLRIYLDDPQIMGSLIAFVVGVSLGNLVYDLFCPVIVKKFESLVIYYENQLRIKRLQLETYPDDPFEASLLHVAEHYIGDLGSRPAARLICLALYVTGFLALLYFAYSVYTTAVTAFP